MFRWEWFGGSERIFIEAGGENRGSRDGGGEGITVEMLIYKISNIKIK